MEHREVSGQFSGPRKPLPKPSLRYDSLLLKKIFRESLVHILLHSTPISTNPERMFHILTWVPFLPSSPRGQEPPSWIRSSHAAHPPYPHFPPWKYKKEDWIFEHSLRNKIYVWKIRKQYQMTWLNKRLILLPFK